MTANDIMQTLTLLGACACLVVALVHVRAPRRRRAKMRVALDKIRGVSLGDAP